MLQLLVTYAAGSQPVDCSRYVDFSQLKINEQINVPTTCTLVMHPIDTQFVCPPQRAYVKIWSTRYNRSLFTGFISAEPARAYLGRTVDIKGTAWEGGQQLSYSMTVTSDEYLLNIKAVQFIPAFVNQTQGQILTTLAEVLCPGFFDTTSIQPGDVVPQFLYTPDQTWCQIAKTFGDGSRYRYKVRDRKIWYTPYGDMDLGIEYDEAKAVKNPGCVVPKALQTQVLSVPLVNDVTIIGDAEAGNNREDYFLGDGFTGNFNLHHKVFQGTSTLLMQESWNEKQNGPNPQTWYLQDPGVNFDFSAGALNVVDTASSPYPLGQSYLLMNNGIELAGSTYFEVGEVTFNLDCAGILGGLYEDVLLNNLLAGFVISSTGNLLHAPGDITNALYWIDQHSGTGVIPTAAANYGLAPDGTMTAGRLQCSQGTGVTESDISMLRSTDGDVSGHLRQTFTVWLKSNTGSNQLVYLAQDGIGAITVTVTPVWQQFMTTAMFGNPYIGLRGTHTAGGSTMDILVWSPVLSVTNGGVIPASGTYVALDGTVLPQLGCAGIHIQPTGPSGTAVGDPFVTRINHNYVLTMVVSAPAYTRWRTVYRTLEGEEYGGAQVDVLCNVTWNIQDYDIVAATGFYYMPEVTSVTLNNVTMPAFAVWALVNNQKLNLTITNSTVATLPMGLLAGDLGPSGLYQPSGLILPMLPADSGGFVGPIVGDSAWPDPASANNILPGPYPLDANPTMLVVGNGYQLQAAQITQGNEADTLAFYAQTLPVAGTPIRFQSWENQAAVSRLQVSASIVAEQALVGDDGVRAAIISDLNPLPRTSEDADNAALAFLRDRLGIFYNGSYECLGGPQGDGYQFHGVTADEQLWPTCGRFFNVNAPRRGIKSQKMLVTQVTMSVKTAVEEVIDFTITFGADLHLEKVLKNFVDIRPKQVLSPNDTVNPPNPRYTTLVDNSFLPDLMNVRATAITSDVAEITVFDNYYGPIEVRQLDTNWGRGNTPDFVGIFQGPVFRFARQQIDQEWFMRPVQGGMGNLPPLTGGILPTWAAGPSYAKGRVLTYGDSTYYSLQNGNSGHEPDTSPTWWQIILPLVASRRSKVIRILYPLRPLKPVWAGASVVQATLQGNGQTIQTWNLQFNFGANDLRNVYGFELRAADDATILVQRPVVSEGSLEVDLSQTPFPYLPSPLNSDYSLYAYFFNQRWDYSHALIVDAELLSGTRLPYIWSPAWQLPYAGDVMPTQHDVFGIQPTYGIDQTGQPVNSILVEGDYPANVISDLVGPPIIVSAASGTSGMLASGNYIVAVAAIDESSSPSTLSNFVAVPVASGNGSITLECRFEVPAPGGADVYVASPDVEHGWSWVGHWAAGVASGTITNFAYNNTGAPDELFDHAILEYRQVFHSGILAAQVQSCTSSSVTIAAAGGAFDTDALAGRILSLLGKDPFNPAAPYLGDIPYANFAITGNIALSGIFTQINIGPNAQGVSPPDLTTIFAVGDLVTVRMRAVSLDLPLVVAEPGALVGSNWTTCYCWYDGPLNGFSVGDPAILSGYTGAAAPLNGTWTISGLTPAIHPEHSNIQLTISVPNTVPGSNLGGGITPLHSSCITDPLLINPFGSPTGLDSGAETGRFLWVIDGTDAGEIQQIPSISGGITINTAGIWTVNPDSTSVMLIVGPPKYVPLQAVRIANRKAFSGPIGAVPEENLGSGREPVWAIRVLMGDSGGNYVLDPWTRIRELYFFGAQGTRLVTTSQTMQPTDGIVLFNTAAIAGTTDTLAAAMTDTTSSAVQLTSGLLVVTNTYIKLDPYSGVGPNTEEIVYVTAGGGTTNLTVIRGALGSTAYTHDISAVVDVPGALVFTLLPLAQVPNQGLTMQKISSDLNYVYVLPGSSGEVEGNSYLLADTSSALGCLVIRAPGL